MRLDLRLRLSLGRMCGISAVIGLGGCVLWCGLVGLRLRLVLGRRRLHLSLLLHILRGLVLLVR